MSLSRTVDVMQATPLFRRLDPKRLRVVAMMGQTLRYRDGERLFEQGSEGEDAYVLLTGEVDVLVAAGDEERVVATLGPGEIFGEIAALTDQPRTSSIRAQAEVEVLQLDRQTILALMREFPDIALELIRILANRLRDTSAQLAAARRELDPQG
ncbi:MAG: cyclic nucleotide-binding domain-containing protein [Pseudomonadota bacterium]